MTEPQPDLTKYLTEQDRTELRQWGADLDPKLPPGGALLRVNLNRTNTSYVTRRIEAGWTATEITNYCIELASVLEEPLRDGYTNVRMFHRIRREYRQLDRKAMRWIYKRKGKSS
jgi:hypothetical protein